MTDARVKCSNCGAELTNLMFGWENTPGWGKGQWVWHLVGFIPLVAFLVWMKLWLFSPHREFATEITVSVIETKAAKDRFDVLGRLKNDGTHTWDRVTVETEVYDKDGNFLDEASSYLSLILFPGAEEHFRISLANPDERILDESSKVVLKITDADED